MITHLAFTPDGEERPVQTVPLPDRITLPDQPADTRPLCTACGQRYVFCRTWCSPCYTRWLKAGKPESGPPPLTVTRNKGRTCSVDGCTRPAYSRTWCRACYYRWAHAGRPDDGPPPSQRPRGPAACRSCGRDDRHHVAHGWCTACYTRWLKAGKPDDGPPPPRTRQNVAADSREDYAWLRDSGESLEEAARRVGINEATARRWDADRKAGAR